MEADNFWKSFSNEAGALDSQFRAGGQQLVFERIETLLEMHGYPFCFDITADEQVCHLILSPEGDSKVAEQIDLLLAAAPAIPGWRFFGRRQRKNLQDVGAIMRQLFLLDPLFFRFRYSTRDPEHRIEIFVPDSSDLTLEEQEGLANTFLWHALGEDVVMRLKIRGDVRSEIPRECVTLSAREFVRQFLKGDSVI